MKLKSFLLVFLFGEILLQREVTFAQKAVPFYVGTYTQGDSEGIYAYQLQPDGKLKQIGVAAKTENPSYLAKTKNGKFLLAVNEVNESPMGGGFVTSFSISGKGLKQVDTKPSGGSSPCYVSVNSAGVVLIANYVSGTSSLLKVTESGKMQGPLDVVQHEGSGTHSRQGGPHAHSIWFRDDRNIISVDLGTNSLWLFTLDRQQNKLLPASPATISMAAEAGPRHLAFHPKGQWLYVINELNSTVTQLKVNASGGYEVQKSISTLPTSYTGENLCADIRISSDGKFLYASNRGHNSLAVYSILDTDGSLQLIGHESVRGNWPRNFSLSPDGSYVVVANQRSNTLVSFKRNKQTGALSFVHEIHAPTPVCILF